jgi:thymidylate synthase ThyX
LSEGFDEAERARLAPYFTDLDGPVFALVNLPEVVKGALFARYSRSAKSLRRLFLDEFLEPIDGARPRVAGVAGLDRAEQLFERVFVEYGDDSVAQLGGVHLACEGVSNVLTKVLERGRLMSYLEQSTRYVPYTDRPAGRWKYVVPDELADPGLRARYVAALDLAYETYAALFEPMERHYALLHPRAESDPPGVHRRAIRAKALDALRGLLPAATTSNLGIYGTGQAYEALLLRMRADPLAESRAVAERMLAELRRVIPAFLKRVDQPERGVRASRYLDETARATAALARSLVPEPAATSSAEVTLTEFDPEGEIKVVAAALYAASRSSDAELLELARRMTLEQRLSVLRAYAGERTNRRHKPGRAYERTAYRFDVVADYGAFRDLQRHRLLTVEWQRLSPEHGYSVAQAVEQAGALGAWQCVMERSRETHDEIAAAGLGPVACYAVSMAYRIRFCLQMNAREAMHVIELRTAPQGHPAYRRVCQTMHRLIAEQAGHRAIAESMRWADHSEVALERLESERASERRRGAGDPP